MDLRRRRGNPQPSSVVHDEFEELEKYFADLELQYQRLGDAEREAVRKELAQFKPSIDGLEEYVSFERPSAANAGERSSTPFELPGLSEKHINSQENKDKDSPSQAGNEFRSVRRFDNQSPPALSIATPADERTTPYAHGSDGDDHLGSAPPSGVGEVPPESSSYSMGQQAAADPMFGMALGTLVQPLPALSVAFPRPSHDYSRRNHRPSWRSAKPCSIFQFLWIASGAASLVVSVAYASLEHDVSGGFTIGAYIVALATMVVLPMQTRHAKNCAC